MFICGQNFCEPSQSGQIPNPGPGTHTACVVESQDLFGSAHRRRVSGRTRRTKHEHGPSDARHPLQFGLLCRVIFVPNTPARLRPICTGFFIVFIPTTATPFHTYTHIHPHTICVHTLRAIRSDFNPCLFSAHGRMQ